MSIYDEAAKGVPSALAQGKGGHPSGSGSGMGAPGAADPRKTITALRKAIARACQG